MKELAVAIELLINLALKRGSLESSAASCPVPPGKAECALANVPGDPGHFVPSKKISGGKCLVP